MAFQRFGGRIVIYLVAICLLFLVTENVAWNPNDCPSFCECYPLYGLRWAECVGRRLYSIHTGVDESVQALDLFNNSIASLGDYELRDAQLTNLKLLNLSSNAISEIGLVAFAGLSDLRVLDLSKNHLYYILPDTLVDNKKLEVLELSGNNLNQHVPRLRSSSLASLGLANCRISHVPTNTFDRLPRLRAVDLSDNMMIQFDLEILKSLPKLGVLMLERNPWSCNSDMYELQDRLIAKSVIFEKVCNYKKVPQKFGGPQKFQKMIALEAAASTSATRTTATTATSTVSAAGRLFAKIKSWRNSLKIETTPAKCPPRNATTEKINDTPGSRFSTVSPYWFVGFGFLLGSALSTVATYFWLTKTIYRSHISLSSLAYLRRRTLRQGSPTIPDHRADLLEHLCRYNNADTRNPTTECPDTPPPPYRDVMLHASRYPRPHIQAIVFANDPVTHDERQVHS